MVLWFETYAGKKDHLFDPVSGFLLNDINDATGEARCTHTNFARDCTGTAASVCSVLSECALAIKNKLEYWQCQHCLNAQSSLCSQRDAALTAGLGDSSIATYTVFNMEVSLSTFSC